MMRQFENLKIAGVLVIIAVLLFGCGKKEVELDVPKRNVFCDADFDVFLKKFINDSLYQKDHIMFPLKLAYYENTSGEDIYEVEEIVNEGNVENMFIVPQKKIKGFQLDYEEQKLVNGDTINYRFKNNGTKRIVDYTFVQKNSCWQLHKVFEDSIFQPDPFRQSKLKQFTNPFGIE